MSMLNCNEIVENASRSVKRDGSKYFRTFPEQLTIISYNSILKKRLQMQWDQCAQGGDGKSNISSVMEFQRWWVLKSKLFGQESTCHQRKIFKTILQVMTVCQKVPKLYFQSQFWMSIFEPLYFLKLCPIFDRLSLLVGIF